MTKELTAEQELQTLFFDYHATARFKNEEEFFGAIMQWHKSECKRFALECVPEQIARVPKWEDAEAQLSNITIDAHNACRGQMIKRIEDKSK